MKVVVKDGRVKNMLKKASNFAGVYLETEMRSMAYRIHAELKLKTPVNKLGGGGATREAWHVHKISKNRTRPVYRIVNRSDTFKFLEYGTRSHGPKTKRALYVPLNSRAKDGWNKGLKFGRDYVLAKRVRGIKPLGLLDKARFRIIRRVPKLVSKVGTKIARLSRG